MREVRYPTPGEILLEEFLKPMGITQYQLAKEIGVPQRRIGEIVAGKRAIACRTCSACRRGFWIGSQADYDRETAKDAMAKTLAKIKPWRKADSLANERT